MKEYVVKLGGRDCRLLYTLDEREELEQMFPRADGTPGSLGALVQGHMLGAGSFRVQVAIVWAGVRHLGKKYAIDYVRECMAKATKEDGLLAITRPAWRSILASGVLGRVVEESEPEPEGDPEETEAGDGDPKADPVSDGTKA